MQSVPQKTACREGKNFKNLREKFLPEKFTADVQIDHHWPLNTHLHDEIYFEKLFSTQVYQLKG